MAVLFFENILPGTLYIYIITFQSVF